MPMQTSEQSLTPETTNGSGLPQSDPQNQGVEGEATVEERDQEAEDQLAATRGWVEERKYHGRQPWVDSRTYNDRYEQVMPAVRGENRRLHDKLQVSERSLTEAMARIEALERQQAETQSARTEVRIQMVEQERN